MNGRRLMPKNIWIKAIKRIGSEGVGRKYRTGFHVLESLDDCQKYSSKFKIKNRRRIISLYCKDLKKKKHSPSPVMLAGEIYIPTDCEIYTL